MFYFIPAALGVNSAELSCEMVNQKSLANLKPAGPGVSANPTGKATRPRRIPVQNSLIRVLDKIEASKDMRGKGPTIDRLWRAWCVRFLLLMEKAKNAEDFDRLTDAMIKMQAIADDKEGPATVEITAGGNGGEMKASKTSTVVLVAGEVVKKEETQTVTQTVELTGAKNAENRPDNRSKRGKS